MSLGFSSPRHAAAAERRMKLDEDAQARIVERRAPLAQKWGAKELEQQVLPMLTVDATTIC
jgi:hypothetical protein